MAEIIGSVLVLIPDFKPICLSVLAEGLWQLEELMGPASAEVSLVDHGQQPVTNVVAQTTMLATVRRRP